ncbi:MAG: DUF1028 domain-containing protein [Candidatus Latescibacteria bacterium]|nr:DUF1028 domain-containing protein [Candidatus Latescibacterota bacterium]
MRRRTSIPLGSLTPLRSFVAVVAALTCVSGSAAASARDPAPNSPPPAFAVVAFDSSNQEWGVAAASGWIAVGARSIDAQAGAGAWLGLCNPERAAGRRAIDHMGRGLGARAALDSLLGEGLLGADQQMALIDRDGLTAGYTGSRCPTWAGERAGRGYLCQGMLLRAEEAVTAMARSFEAARGTLGERMLAALAAGEALAFVRGHAQSAALLIVRDGGGLDGRSDRLTDLRVDASSDAIAELRRVYAIHATTFLPAAHARFGDDARRRGDSISAEREYEKAEAGFRSAVARSPKDPDALNELSWFLATHGRELEEAIRYAQAAIIARPDDPNLHDTLAEAQYRSGVLADAIESAERAVRLSGGAGRYVERLERLMRERSTLGGAAGSDSTAKPSR